MFLATALLSVSLGAQPPIEHVDIYGLRKLEPQAVFAALGIDPANPPATIDRDALTEKLRAIDGVDDAIVMTMRSPRRSILLLGVREHGTPQLQLRAAPDGDATLPDGMREAYDDLMSTSFEGMRKGKAGQESPDGHSISTYPPAREIADRLVEMARADIDRVRQVLRTSGNAEHRGAAAHALAYARDKASIIDDLSFAMTDPDSTVRNNSIRALSVLARWARQNEVELELDVDPTPLISMLDSLEWTDRNKGAALLDELTRARDPKLLDALRSQALPALTEMGSWGSYGHAAFSLRILGRIAGIEEAELMSELSAVRKIAQYDERMAWLRRVTSKIDGAR